MVDEEKNRSKELDKEKKREKERDQAIVHNVLKEMKDIENDKKNISSINMRRHSVTPRSNIVSLRKHPSFLDDISFLQESIRTSPLFVEKPKSPEEKKLIELQKSMESVLSLLEKMEKNNETMVKTLTRVALISSKLHEQGKMNDETFGKLDRYLRFYNDGEGLEE